ncbi:MAG: ABC transporter permease, partial [Acidimicrobiia bacterium]
YVALLLYGTWTLLGVTEEKSSRVVEIILSTTRPASLLGGKVIGIGLVALTQLAIVFAVIGGMLYVLGGGSPDVGGATGGTFDVSIDDVSVAQAGILLLWFVIGFSIYNVLFAAIGSLVSRVEDAQSANIPLSLSVVGSLFLSFAALGDPDGVAAVVGTFIPFSAPFVVPVRFALEGIAPWEVVASIVVSVVAFVVFIRIAGRIYEGAILRTGERVRIRDAWRGDR